MGLKSKKVNGKRKKWFEKLIFSEVE